jgi:hypothetical protein
LVAVTGTNHHGFFFILGIGYFFSRESLTDPSIITVTTEDFEAGFVAGVKRDHEMLKALKAEWGKGAIIILSLSIIFNIISDD